MHLALDKGTGDLIKNPLGGIERVSEGRFVVQQVQSKLRTWLEEWALDYTVGWLGVNDFEKGFDRFDIETRARNIILNTQGVLAVSTLTTEFKDRKLTIEFTAKTIYGDIELTIPWG